MTAMINPDAIRRKAGLSRPQWQRLISAGPEDALASDVSLSYGRFLASIRRNLDYEFREPAYQLEDGTTALSTIQAARALGIGEFHLANLRDRRKLMGTKLGRRSVYTRPQLEEFLSGPQSSLSSAFLRWYELEDKRPRRSVRVRPDTRPSVARKAPEPALA